MPPATVIAVCRGLPREHVHPDGTRVRTAIFKTPAPGPVRVLASGLEGDGQGDRLHHGGPDKAVYALSAAHYPFFASLLGRGLGPGGLGENLTLSSADEGVVRRGDRYRCGTALLEVTTPRGPCRMVDLAARPGFLQPFFDSGRWGFYLRVVEEGFVAPGDPWTLETPAPAGPTVAEMIAGKIARKGEG